MTTVVNGTTLPGFAAVAFLVARFIWDLARGADDARKRIAELEKKTAAGRSPTICWCTCGWTGSPRQVTIRGR